MSQLRKTIGQEAYVGDVSTQNPGPQRKYEMTVQLVYRDGAKEVARDREGVSYRPGDLLADARDLKKDNRRGKLIPVVPDVPGFDGKPLDVQNFPNTQKAGSN